MEKSNTTGLISRSSKPTSKETQSTRQIVRALSVIDAHMLTRAKVDIHFPHLLVGDTLDFASETKTPWKNNTGEPRASVIRSMTTLYTKLLGLQHTLQTKVGNEYVHGISGGERKRVSLAEAVSSLPGGINHTAPRIARF